MGGRVDRRRFGQQGEDAAVAHLLAQGFRVRARNFVCRWGELDIVAERDGLVAFVEVRMRSHAAWGDPAHTVSGKKQRRVVKAALHYLFAHDLRGKEIRFDVVTVLGHGDRQQVEHIPNAFDAGM
ncbi:MAG: YraN family protein [Myxococcaceae bacterium]|nr:YraN family protein [Myxococcaceae bacterium]